MAHLIFRCHKANRVITSGIEVDPAIFSRLPLTRTVPCRFCGGDHNWELVAKVPDAAAAMSLRAEDFLGRSVQSDGYAIQATDPDIREMHRRMAGQWYQLAVEHEAKADMLS